MFYCTLRRFGKSSSSGFKRISSTCLFLGGQGGTGIGGALMWSNYTLFQDSMI